MSAAYCAESIQVLRSGIWSDSKQRRTTNRTNSCLVSRQFHSDSCSPTLPGHPMSALGQAGLVDTQKEMGGPPYPIAPSWLVVGTTGCWWWYLKAEVNGDWGGTVNRGCGLSGSVGWCLGWQRGRNLLESVVGPPALLVLWWIVVSNHVPRITGNHVNTQRLTWWGCSVSELHSSANDISIWCTCHDFQQGQNVWWDSGVVKIEWILLYCCCCCLYCQYCLWGPSCTVCKK